MYDINVVHDDYQRLEGNLRVDQSGELFLAMTASADPSEGLATGVAGVVTDQVTGEPIPRVVVNVAAQGRVATTSATGRFTVPDLMPGRHEVTFSHLGYQRRVDSVPGGAPATVLGCELVLRGCAYPDSPHKVNRKAK